MIIESWRSLVPSSARMSCELCFFFSSRRRHTRLQGDWSSDVCSSDLLALACVAAGADESGLSDTTGMANPAQVRRLFTRLRAELGEHAGAAHMHNTRGLGLANCLAAYEAGVRTFDASLAGLGGCPYAPGASGNVEIGRAHV